MAEQQQQQHAVTLLALNGKEKAVTLCITKEGVQLLSATDGKVFNKFPFTIIKKWLPASARSRDPGTPDCLDLQVETNKGARDLRMRCESAAAVQLIIQQLRTTVMSIVQTDQPGSSKSGRPAWAGFGDTAASIGASTYATAHSTPSTARAGDQDPDSELTVVSRHGSFGPNYMNDAYGGVNKLKAGSGHPSMSVLASTQSLGSEVGQLNPGPETIVVTPTGLSRIESPGLARIESSGLARNESPGLARIESHRLYVPETVEVSGSPHSGDESAAQIQFLESMIKRLTAELARKQTAADPSTANIETDILVDDGTQLPVWLKDRRYLNPLLTAYDERIAELEMEAADRSAAMTRLQEQVESVIAENESLREQLSKSIESKALMAAVAESNAVTTSDGALKLVKEEAALLRQENDLLVAQQSELDAEIQRLHAQLEQQTQQAVAMAQENARMMARVHEHVNGAQEIEARHSKLQSALSTAENRVMILEQHLAEAQTMLDDERIKADTATRTLDELQRMQGKLKAESVANAQAARLAADRQAAIQAELAGLKERFESVTAQLSASRLEAAELHDTLAGVNDRLAEYQKRDAEAFSRIREAQEAAESAKLSRDSAVSRQSDLEREVELLQQRLASLRTAVRDQVYGEFQGKVHALEAELASTKEQLKAADAQAVEFQVLADRSAREVASLNAELAALKEDLGETLSSKSKVTLMTLTTMERIQEVERQRDEAAQKLESVSRTLERSQRDWTLEKQTLEAELRSLRKAVVDKDTNATLVGSEAAKNARQIEALTSELAAVKEAKTRAEAELRQQVTASRSERDQEVKAMAARLESALAACSKSVAEAERMIETKNALLAKWKEEASMVASKLEKALVEHRRELDMREAAVHDLRLQLQAMHGSHAALIAELEDTRAAAVSLQAALQESESRASHMHMQLLAAANREEELNQEVRSIHGVLERARRESKRSDRPPDDLSAKLMSIRQAGQGIGSMQSMNQ